LLLDDLLKKEIPLLIMFRMLKDGRTDPTEGGRSLQGALKNEKKADRDEIASI
jgi:hypothetical protein